MIGTGHRVPVIDVAKCRTCKRCLARQSCRLKAIVQLEPNELPYVNQTLCRGCLVCTESCPFQAVVVDS